MLKKVFSLIPENKKKQGVFVALLVPFRSVLNLLGIASLIPALLLVLDDSGKYPFLSEHTWIVVAGIMAFVICKGVVNVALSKYQSRYLLSLYKHFSTEVFDILFKRGLQHVKNSNTGSLAWEINGLCYNMSTGYLSSVFSFWGEIIFSALVLVSIAIYSPVSTLLIILGLSPLVVLYFYLIRGKLYKIGKEEFEERKAQHRRVQNVFKGYSEITISGAYAAENKKFEASIDKIADYRLKSTVLNGYPSILLEVSAIFIIGIITLFGANFADSNMRVFLGIFAVAVMRMIPSIRGIISSWSSIKSTAYAIDTIGAYLATKPSDDACEAKELVKDPSALVISVQSLGFQFADSPDKKLFEDVTFDVAAGEIIGIRGRSGSGKTTLFNILLGLFPATEGTVKVFGQALESSNAASWHKCIGYVPQEVFIDDNLTLEENVALGFETIDPTKMQSAIERAELKEFVEGLPNGLQSILGECGAKISGGQKQRIGIARALYKDASVLFFDEATSSLDSQTEKDIDNAVLSLRGTDLTIIIISHRDTSLSICDRIINL